MTRFDDDSDLDGLDKLVRAFEVSYARHGRAEIAEFLPLRDHPLYASVLCELIRVDLEFGWERGCPRPLSEYQRAFPELQDNRDGLLAIAFEESRLRRQAEEGSPLVESRRHGSLIKIDGSSRRAEGAPGQAVRRRSSDGPSGDDPSVDPGEPSPGDDAGRSRHDEVEQAALAYRNFRRHYHEGDSAALDSWCASFSGCATHARLFRDVHLSDPRTADRLARGLTSLPAVGDDFLGFELIGELGRGAFSRVYLARQGELADRLVALKVSPWLSRETQTLAQLQHTNIVPIYSIHRIDTLQVVCMPYYGSTTLRHAYDEIKKQGTLPISGRGLLSILHDRESCARRRGGSSWPEVETAEGPDAASGGTPAGTAPPPSSRPPTDTLTMLEGLTYVQAVLWMASRLADGLAHAHERGILHRDLKLANILLTNEGQPMLLDFNLSEDLKVRSGTAAEIGGTLPYMAPEHLDAFRNGTRPVDARSDLYSIGIILFELLTGRRPFAIPDGPRDGMLNRLIEDRLGPPPGVRCWNKTVTPAVQSIVRHCLEPDPERRYQTARELHEDLERHIAHRPLRYAPEPSLSERMAKCAWRHPTLFSSTSIALLAFSLISLLGAAAWLGTEDTRNDSARFHHAEFQEKLERCQLLLNTNNGLSERLGDGILLAGQALGHYDIDGPGDWTARPLVRRLPADDRQVLLKEVSELVLLAARARVALAERTKSKRDLIEALQQGVTRLDRVERFAPPSAALYEDRARFHDALGRSDLAARDRALARRHPPCSARDFYLLGTSLLARGSPDLAELHLGRAVALDARQFWAWFVLGICHYDRGRYTDAVLDFSVSTTLAPAFAWPHMNRGLALARSGRLPEARQAYDRALEINPKFVEALYDRALACLELGDPAQAASDMDRAIALGQRTPRFLVARAEALARLARREEAERAFAEAIHADPNDPMPLVARGYSRLADDQALAGADADFARALDLDPRNARAQLGRAYILRSKDLRAALAQVELALDIEPDFADALQLRALLRARLGDTAAEGDVDRLLQAPTPHRLYNAACALAILSGSSANPRLVPRALDLLGRALDSGISPERIADDSDLEALREYPQFPRLINRKEQGHRSY